MGRRGDNGNGAVIPHGVCDELNTYQSVKTTNFLSSWTGGYGRVLSGAVFTFDMALLTDQIWFNGSEQRDTVGEALP